MNTLRQRLPKAESLDDDAIDVQLQSPAPSDLTEGLSSTRVTAIKDEAASSTSTSPSLSATKIKSSRSSSISTSKSKAMVDSAIVDSKLGEEDSNLSPKMELDSPVKDIRSSRKGVPRMAQLFDSFPDATLEATSYFQLLDWCTYANKFLGYTEHAMECDCAEEWDSSTKQNDACGEDSDCINRATKMECIGDCACGTACQNQRFQRKQYADVSVIRTEKKGYGLRANTNLKSGDFIFEYLGEVINEPQFRRRMVQYDEEGIKHFYFMSLSKGEFVDATKKGNLGRFCNHSCNPNCYVDKWVVGDKLRMGIFAERKIRAGEELVFNYNVDRYGANPQPCYCGESNCTGFIGGKTQTGPATKLSTAIQEALGIEDADAWDTTVARRPRKKKTEEDDEDYVESVEAKSLDADGVTKVMAALMQCKEKWIAAKLLERIQRAHDETVRNRVVKMHGYQILNSQLAAWKDDENIVLQILDILNSFPRLTRNKIVDSKIESTMKPLTEHGDERVATQTSFLLEEWSKLELAYRIPRKKRVPALTSTPTKGEQPRFERRESAQERKRSRSRSRTPPKGPSAISAPSGPRSSLPQRSNTFFPPRAPTFRPPLPRGWFEAKDGGRTYYYSASGKTTWQRPTQPAEQPPPPPKQPSQQDVLKSIIDDIVSAKEKEQHKKNTPDTPKEQQKAKKERKEEKWRSFDEEKRKKLYENTLFPHISHVMNKYKQKIPKDDLKRFAKEIAKKLVNSDFNSGRVQDPTKIDEKHQQKVKKFCKDFFDKAAHKHKKHEEERVAKKVSKGHNGKPALSMTTATSVPQISTPHDLDASPNQKIEDENTEDEDVHMSEDNSDSEDDSSNRSPSRSHKVTDADTLKRKRSASDAEIDAKHMECNALAKSPVKRLNADAKIEELPPPPPPPPAPPAQSPSDNMSAGDTPHEQDHEDGTDLLADTSFMQKSMADVLAEAQQDDVEMDIDEDHETDLSHSLDQSAFESGVQQTFANPLVDGQQMVEVIQQALEQR